MPTPNFYPGQPGAEYIEKLNELALAGDITVGVAAAAASAAVSAAAAATAAEQSGLAITQAGLSSTQAANAAAAAGLASAAANNALASANYKGAWSTLSGALNIPASVQHAGQIWLLTTSLANVATATPGVSASWLQLSSDIGEVIKANVMLTIDPTQPEVAGQRYQNPNNAFGYLAEKRIARGIIVTLQCVAGVHTYSSEWVNFQHPDSEAIELVGAAPDVKNVLAQTLTPGTNVTGSAGDYRVTIQLDNVSGVAIGDVVALHRFTATSEFCGLAMGAWQVHAVDTVNSKITVRNTAKRSTFLPAGQTIDLTGGKCTVFKTVVRPAGGAPGAAINLCTAAYVRDIAVLCRIAGTNTDGTAGMATTGAALHLASYGLEQRYTNERVHLENVVGVYAPWSGIEIGRGRYVEIGGNDNSVFMMCGNVGRGMNIFQGGTVVWMERGRLGAGGPHCVFNGNGGHGVVVEERSSSLLYGIPTSAGRLHVACGNTGQGVLVSNSSLANLGALRAEGNLSNGAGVSASSVLYINDAAVLWNNSDGINAQLGSYVNFSGSGLARTKYNTYAGMFCANNSLIHAGCVAAGNTAAYVCERNGTIRGGKVVTPGVGGMVASTLYPANTDRPSVPGWSVCDQQFEFQDYWYGATQTSANTTLAAGGRYWVDTAGLVLALPPAPMHGQTVDVFSPSAITTIARNGKNINGAAADFVLQRTVSGSQLPAVPEARLVKFTFDSAGNNWTVSYYDYSTWASDAPYLPYHLEIGAGTKCLWPNNKYMTIAAGTYKLPATPNDGDQITVTTGSVTTSVLDRNGKTINGATTSNYTLSTAWKTYTIRYSSNAGWIVN